MEEFIGVFLCLKMEYFRVDRAYYIAIRKKVMADGMVKQVVKLPDMPKYTRKLLKGAGFKNIG